MNWLIHFLFLVESNYASFCPFICKTSSKVFGLFGLLNIKSNITFQWNYKKQALLHTLQKFHISWKLFQKTKVYAYNWISSQFFLYFVEQCRPIKSFYLGFFICAYHFSIQLYQSNMYLIKNLKVWASCVFFSSQEPLYLNYVLEKAFLNSFNIRNITKIQDATLAEATTDKMLVILHYPFNKKQKNIWKTKKTQQS